MASIAAGTFEQLSLGLCKGKVTVANGASLSNTIKLEGRALSGILIPSAWTTANLTFQGAVEDDSDASATYFNLYDAAGIEMQVVAAASRLVILDPVDFASIRWLKVRSGTSGSAVNQGADRDIYLMARNL